MFEAKIIFSPSKMAKTKFALVYAFKLSYLVIYVSSSNFLGQRVKLAIVDFLLHNNVIHCVTQL